MHPLLDAGYPDLHDATADFRKVTASVGHGVFLETRGGAPLRTVTVIMTVHKSLTDGQLGASIPDFVIRFGTLLLPAFKPNRTLTEEAEPMLERHEIQKSAH